MTKKSYRLLSFYYRHIAFTLKAFKLVYNKLNGTELYTLDSSKLFQN